MTKRMGKRKFAELYELALANIVSNSSNILYICIIYTESFDSFIYQLWLVVTN